MNNMTRWVSLAVVSVLILFLGLMFFKVIAPFLLPLFLASIVAMLVQPIQAYFERKTKGHTQISAGLTTGSVIVGFSVPMVLAVLLATLQISLFVTGVLENHNWDQVFANVRHHFEIDTIVEYLQPYVSEEIDAGKLQADLQSGLRSGLKLLVSKTVGFAGQAVGQVGNLLSIILQLMMFVIALFYFLADGPAMISAAEGLIPVSLEYQRELRMRFYHVVRAVVLATFLAALAQGFATATLLWILGFKQFVILFLLATFASMVPLFGTWLVWGPCMIWLAVQGHWVSASILLVIGAGVIGMLDNIIRPWVLKSHANLHPLLAFVCVLGGVQVMGIWGVFIAPIVAANLHALIVIFNTEINALSKDQLLEKLRKNPEDVPDLNASQNEAAPNANAEEPKPEPKESGEQPPSNT